MSAEADGIEVLLGVLNLREVVSLIERTARWVAPETFRLRGEQPRGDESVSQ